MKQSIDKKYLFLDKSWLDVQHRNNKTVKPEELEKNLEYPPEYVDENILDRVQGSIIGMALGDACGAHVEFRPQTYLAKYPVEDLKGGGTWGLKKGQVTSLRMNFFDKDNDSGTRFQKSSNRL